MVKKMPKSSPKASRRGGKKQPPPALRSTSGAGFEFEDLVCAWQWSKALAGEQLPPIGVVTSSQAQVSSLGWKIDDLLFKAEAAGVTRSLAISVKGNFQVSGAGLPPEFVTRAWEQWRNLEGPFNRHTDGLALITQGTEKAFDPVWREVKNACIGSDTSLTYSRIRNSERQFRIFDNIQKRGAASVEDTIELIRALHVLPTDLQLARSESETKSILRCRNLLESAREDEAQALWDRLVAIAREVRLRSGAITSSELLTQLRGRFALHHHPDFRRDWETLVNVTVDHKARIETELPTRYSVPRAEEKASLKSVLSENVTTVVFGDSGSGKSALVKSVLDDDYPSWNQLWLGSEEVKAALSAVRRGDLPLTHELSLILHATVKRENVLIIDAAERIEASEFIVIRRLLLSIAPSDDETVAAWRVVVVTQTQSWAEGLQTILDGHQPHLFEVGALKIGAVKLALHSMPSLRWLVSHDDTIAPLTNLRTLAWIMKAGAALASDARGLGSHTAISDWLWNYWTDNRADVQALTMRLAQREASFERTFALSDLEATDTATFTQRPAELPLQLNRRTNRIEFEHDLAADWARFQFLKQIWQDTPRWAALAANPLWTNSLRMLGQFLLRQPVQTGMAWDAAFETTVQIGSELAHGILLDALCLDPNAQSFLTERADLLFDKDARNFTQLLLRFHHIATLPTGAGAGLNAVVGVYMDAQHRSVVFGRWPPLLSFLIAQRERLETIVSSSLAKVIETWLTKTPHALQDGSPMPFRREMTELALAMARTVQVEKRLGVIYLSRDSSLYTAPLAGALDLPREVGEWALEVAERREIGEVTKRRISELQAHEALAHAERLKTDPRYKRRYEVKEQASFPRSFFREPLPPWLIGPSSKVDIDFREASFKANALHSLMRSTPKTAAEVLLALIVEDEPERGYGSHRGEISLGLQYSSEAYPTAFWKSPFFHFLSLSWEAALGSLIALVDFCTEHWTSGVSSDSSGSIPTVTLQLPDGTDKEFFGWWPVFDWPQSNHSHNGNLFCALDALERWLTLKVDAEESISVYIEKIFREGRSIALVSVLLNVAKYAPSLLAGPLANLVTSANLFYWDSQRVSQVNHKFDGWNWHQGGQAMFEFARDWTLAPHRQRKLLDVVVEIMFDEDEIEHRLQVLLSTWELPQNAKEAMDFKLLFARLDAKNYQISVDPSTHAKYRVFVLPESLRTEVEAWQAEAAPILRHIVVPDRCEQRLRNGTPLDDDEATYLFDLLKECELHTEDDDGVAKSRCRFATAGTLVTLGSTWLAQNSQAQKRVIEIVRLGAESVASTGGDFRKQGRGIPRDELKFVAYAVSHLWLAGGEQGLAWETCVLRVLTSGDLRAAAVVVDCAFEKREKLGSGWWQLLRAGLLWAGLLSLTPHNSDGERNGEDNERTWNAWLARLRRMPLHGVRTTADDLNLKRVAAGIGRLDFQRQARLYDAGHNLWRGQPLRTKSGFLGSHFLEVLFEWLLKGGGSGNNGVDTSLVLRVWEYEIDRAKEDRKDDDGEYGLPSQNLGYEVLEKLAELSLAAPAQRAREVWEPVLTHGPAAHYALQRFIQALFSCLKRDGEAAAFEPVWRETLEFCLVADWTQPGLWYRGERLICDLLGFGNEDALSRLQPGAASRMKKFYESWAALHLARDDECITRFCHFLLADFGSELRLDGICWLASMLNDNKQAIRSRRESTGEALLELVAGTLSSHAQALSQHTQARQALLNIAAALAAQNGPTALALQERIKLLR